MHGFYGGNFSDYGPKSQVGLFARTEANRKRSTTWSHCIGVGEGRLSQTRSIMDDIDANDMYKEKRLLGPFRGLTITTRGGRTQLTFASNGDLLMKFFYTRVTRSTFHVHDL